MVIQTNERNCTVTFRCSLSDDISGYVSKMFLKANASIYSNLFIYDLGNNWHLVIHKRPDSHL